MQSSNIEDIVSLVADDDGRGLAVIHSHPKHYLNPVKKLCQYHINSLLKSTLNLLNAIVTYTSFKIILNENDTTHSALELFEGNFILFF